MPPHVGTPVPVTATQASFLVSFACPITLSSTLTRDIRTKSKGKKMVSPKRVACLASKESKKNASHPAIT